MLCCSYVSSVFIKPPICTPLGFFFLLFNSTINVTYFAFFFLSIFPNMPFPICFFYYFENESFSRSVVFSCLQPYGLYPPGSSVRGILQPRILKWVAFSFSKGSSQPRDQTCVSCIVSQILYCLSHQSPYYLRTLYKV